MAKPQSMLSEYYLSEAEMHHLMEHLVDGESDSATLLAFADRIEFEPEDVLMWEGKTDAAVYILTEGTLEVSVEVDGKQQSVATIEPRAIVGEQSFIDGEPRTATVFAKTKGVAHRLTDSGFEQLRGVHPEVACAFLGDVSRALAKRLRHRS